MKNHNCTILYWLRSLDVRSIPSLLFNVSYFHIGSLLSQVYCFTAFECNWSIYFNLCFKQKVFFVKTFCEELQLYYFVLITEFKCAKDRKFTIKRFAFNATCLLFSHQKFTIWSVLFHGAVAFECNWFFSRFSLRRIAFVLFVNVACTCNLKRLNRFFASIRFSFN